MNTKNKSSNEWTVLKSEAGQTLQEFLALRMKASKRVAKQHIDARVVRVNGTSVWIAHHKVKANDAIIVASAVKSPTAISSNPQKIKILFEDEYYMVVDKPRGMLVNSSNFSLESIVKKQTGISTVQVSHRLDRDTTGCLIMSKTPDAHEKIVEVFKSHNIVKVYRTVVYGRWSADSSTIELPINDERALTNIKCLKANSEASHLAVRIETGKTHQIRRHLAMSRHPVVGDTVYGPKNVENEKLTKLTYPLLHAVEIEFDHPFNGNRVKVFSPIPQDFFRWMTSLKLIQR